MVCGGGGVVGQWFQRYTEGGGVGQLVAVGYHEGTGRTQ